MTNTHLKKIKDDFQAADPDSLMASVSRLDLGRTLVVSLVWHLLVIFLLSLGNVGVCLKYRTLNLPHAITLRSEAAKEAQAALKAEEIEKRKRERLAKVAPVAAAKGMEETDSSEADAGTPAIATGTSVAPIVSEINEVSDERPKSSSLSSIDDLLD